MTVRFEALVDVGIFVFKARSVKLANAFGHSSIKPLEKRAAVNPTIDYGIS